jgi:hypothetical protein
VHFGEVGVEIEQARDDLARAVQEGHTVRGGGGATERESWCLERKETKNSSALKRLSATWTCASISNSKKVYGTGSATKADSSRLRLNIWAQ